MWNESVKYEVIAWTKRNCHSQGNKTKIRNDMIVDLIFESSFEEYL
jgi:hypothetical protein